MAAWDFLLTGWVQGLYGALRSQGIGACLLAAAAGWQLACWGLRLTEAEFALLARPTGGMRSRRRSPAAERLRGARASRWLGGLLQAAGALLMAAALVALARTVASG